jgi:hypothetical protein
MESTGMRGKIQVSGATADLIKASGKETWVKKRKEMVQAKGKGSMQTFVSWLNRGSRQIRQWNISLIPYLFAFFHIQWVNPTSRKNSSTGSGESSSRQDTSTRESPASDVQDIIAVRPVNHRLVSWMVELLLEDIKKIVYTRRLCGVEESAGNLTFHRPEGSCLLDEIQTKIKMPDFNAKAVEAGDYKSLDISPDVVEELRDYVSSIATMYRKNPFHNFEHACHVTMSTKKLLKRIVAPDMSHVDVSNHGNAEVELANRLHDYTHGINSDPLTSFALTFSSLIHDVDHMGKFITQTSCFPRTVFVHMLN